MALSDTSWLRHIALAAMLLAATYAALIGLLAWQQERLIFFPQALPADHRFEPAADVQERWIDVPLSDLIIVGKKSKVKNEIFEGKYDTSK